MISLLRVFILHEALKSQDLSYANVTSAAWTTTEVNIAIVSASLPALKAWLGKILPKPSKIISFGRAKKEDRYDSLVKSNKSKASEQPDTDPPLPSLHAHGQLRSASAEDFGAAPASSQLSAISRVASNEVQDHGIVMEHLPGIGEGRNIGVVTSWEQSYEKNPTVVDRMV